MILMRRAFRLFCLVCVTILYAVPIAAQDPVIDAISTNGYNVIKHLNARAGDELIAADAEKIKKAIMANKTVDLGEVKLLQYLQAGQSFTIQSRGAGYDDLIFTKAVSPDAKTVLSTIVSLSFDDPVEQQWTRADVADFKQLIKTYQGSTEGRDKVLGAIGKGLKAAQAVGGFEQSLAAMKGEMTRWSAKLSKLGGADYPVFKRMLFEAAVTVDRQASLSYKADNGAAAYEPVDGGIPDYLYKHLGE